MVPQQKFEESIRRQIEIHLARTPTERFLAFLELQSAIEALEPKNPESIERRRKAMDARRKKKIEGIRATFRQLMATGKLDPPRSDPGFSFDLK